jgi:PD-(D/E)XK endonuclease
MKKRKPKISDKKLRGEWSEMHFMLRATDHDLPVCKPWGDSRSYDFVVGWPGHFVAVQVKSTTLELEEGGYTCCICGGGNKPYPPGSFDFLAAYVIWDDAWYIVPAEIVLGQARITVYPQSEESKYAGYREAWHLLGVRSEDDKGIDLQACAEEISESGLSQVSTWAEEVLVETKCDPGDWKP